MFHRSCVDEIIVPLCFHLKTLQPSYLSDQTRTWTDHPCKNKNNGSATSFSRTRKRWGEGGDRKKFWHMTIYITKFTGRPKSQIVNHKTLVSTLRQWLKGHTIYMNHHPQREEKTWWPLIAFDRTSYLASSVQLQVSLGAMKFTSLGCTWYLQTKFIQLLQGI